MSASWGDRQMTDWRLWEAEVDPDPYDWDQDEDSGLTGDPTGPMRGIMYALGLEGAVALVCFLVVMVLWVVF